MRIITIIAGVLMLLTGVWCFANPGASFLSMAFVLGLSMVIAGVTGALNYFLEKNRHAEGSWVVAESILTFLLGCVVLSNQLIVDAMIIVFFGMWLMFSGCLRIVASFQLRKLEEPNWGWTLGFGILGVLGGLYAFLNPIALGLAVIVLLGVFFIIQGANVLVLGINMPHKRKVKRK